MTVCDLLITVGAYSCSLVIKGAVYVWAIVESSLSSLHRSSSPLVHEVPMKTSERPMLVTLVL